MLQATTASPYRVHLRSTSTNKRHSLALTPILGYPCHKEWCEYQLVGSIFGDHLVLLFCSRGPGVCGYDRLAIWSSCTGDLLAVRSPLAIYTTLLTPLRQCTYNNRFFFLSGGTRPFNRRCIAQDNDLPLHPHTSPPSFPFQLSSGSPTKTHLLRTANNRAILPTRAASRPGVCTPLPVRSPWRLGRRLVNRVPRPRQTHMGAPSF